jgi:hypothetical protein
MMNFQNLASRIVFLAMIFSLSVMALVAQKVIGVDAIKPEQAGESWRVDIALSQLPKMEEQIKNIYLLDNDSGEIIKLKNLRRIQPTGSGTISPGYTAEIEKPLEMIQPPVKPGEKPKPPQLKNYELRFIVESNAEKEEDKQILRSSAGLVLLNPNVAKNDTEKVEANSAEDADVYISGEMNGAFKKKTSYSTEIKLQKYAFLDDKAKWRWTPFFKLKASTNPEADPDKMEIGIKFRRVVGRFAGIPGALFDNGVKIESQRDFKNTNLIYDTRFTFLPPELTGWLGTSGKIGTKDYRVFLNPFIGGEFGKNLRSPLPAAEGDGIARALAGTELRFAFFLKEGEEPNLDWTSSYTRRWLFTDELGFKPDDDGNLQLVRFGKSPRDYFESKVTYGFNKFVGGFIEYSWGQVPPSYKFLDHQFRVGLVYKYKFGVK